MVNIFKNTLSTKNSEAEEVVDKKDEVVVEDETTKTDESETVEDPKVENSANEEGDEENEEDEDKKIENSVNETAQKIANKVKDLTKGKSDTPLSAKSGIKRITKSEFLDNPKYSGVRSEIGYNSFLKTAYSAIAQRDGSTPFTQSMITSADTGIKNALEGFTIQNAVGDTIIDGSTDAKGGTLVPDIFLLEIFAVGDQKGTIYEDVRVQMVSGAGNTYKYTVRKNGQAKWEDQNVAGNANQELSYSQQSVELTAINADFVVNLDILADSPIAVYNDMVISMRSQLFNGISDSLINGNTNTRTGVLHIPNKKVILLDATKRASDTTPQILTAMINAVEDTDARQEGVFYGHRSVLGQINASVDKNGRLYFQDYPIDGKARLLYGVRYVETDHMALGTAPDQVFLAYGKFDRALKIVQKGGAVITTSTVGTLNGINLFEENSIGLKARIRFGHNTQTNEGMVFLSTNTT